MERHYLQSINYLFDAQQELLPIPTHITPKFSSKRDIKCVMFDIYGTLLISRSGDIDKIKLSPSFILESFAKCGIKITTPNPGTCAEHIIKKYKSTIKKLKAHNPQKDAEKVEIDIRQVWEILLEELFEESLIDKPRVDEVSLLAIFFETLSNSVYPMPHMKEIINWLRKRDIPMGIVSNAQFYTPIIMNYFLTSQTCMQEDIKFFDPELSVYSYKEKISKPDTALFVKALDNCREKYKLQDSEVLFVGNDMLKDIYPANLAGMQTALFAGDARSLRLREDRAEVADLLPDYTINSLEQITEIVL